MISVANFILNIYKHQITLDNGDRMRATTLQREATRCDIPRRKQKSSSTYLPRTPLRALTEEANKNSCCSSDSIDKHAKAHLLLGKSGLAISACSIEHGDTALTFETMFAGVLAYHLSSFDYPDSQKETRIVGT